MTDGQDRPSAALTDGSVGGAKATTREARPRPRRTVYALIERVPLGGVQFSGARDIPEETAGLVGALGRRTRHGS
ncbi:hypothetical protein ACFUIW_25795 [Streptomyces sp. NPDC057245]|uniref:hypothetical protein n=1 Tax=Streptomyces sp. NPDC057245 TaxID=3346065 RepID=UPI00362F4A07